MLLQELDYDLPEDLIATRAVEPRDAARMLVVGRDGAGGVQHRHVRDLPEFLRPGDLLVLNTSRVLPAWLVGRRVGTGGRFTGLYLGLAGPEASPPDTEAESNVDLQPRGRPVALWRVLLRGGHLRPGAVLTLEREEGPGGSGDGASPRVDTGVRLRLESKDAEEPGGWIVRVFVGEGQAGETDALLALVGATPIPPYIRTARRHAGLEVPDAEDRARYQTMYASAGTGGGEGSVAAPTAGLHLTPELLDRMRGAGVGRAEVMLHVGSGTFRPVETPVVEDHPMHVERCGMTRQALDAIQGARARGGRVICVGTTSARTVETYAQQAEEGRTPSAWVETRLLITPGYRWRWVDGLLTNFHLPRSTLLAMVGALFASGMERVREVYGEAIGARYRFFSYGDAMLILPGSKTPR